MGGEKGEKGERGQRGARDWGRGRGASCFTLDDDGFTCSRVLDEPEVWRVELLMGDTFLPSVNAFVLLDGGEALVVDSGTSDELNDTRLMRALVGLGVDPARATVFFTHAHLDHMGLARELALAGAHVVVSAGVRDDMRRFADASWRDEMVARLAGEGFSPAESAELADTIFPHTLDLARAGVPFDVLAPGERVRVGRWELSAVPTPGHTLGHTALWESRTRTAFLGDAVLYLCSTCIGFWGEGEDPMGEQIASLRRLAGMGIGHALLGHGMQDGDVAARCEKNAAHHERRSARALAAIRERPGQTGAELMWAMGWRVRPGDWASTPALTRWFLASESVAHLDHLVATGAVLRTRDATGTTRYRPA
ncbi:MBL fold metallo-hydrolase [Thermophilibacter sp.]